MEGFAEAGPTIEFLRNIDEVFDILNVKSKFGKNSKAPLTKSSYQEHVDESLNAAGDGKNIPENIEKTKNRLQRYIRSLTLMNDIPLLQTRKHTGFTGFVNGIESLFLMGKYLLFDATAPLDYVLSFKVSQDHLETFFSSIRARNGFCVNPTSVQFMAAFKALLMNAEVRVSTGNCSLLQVITILNPLQNYQKPANTKADQPFIEDDEDFLEVDSVNKLFSCNKNREFKVKTKKKSESKCKHNCYLNCII